MNSEMVSLRVRTETLVLHPERAVLWPARRTVIVADTHFGKGSLFRHHGMAVPEGTDDHDRGRLSRLVEASGASRLVVLGDFLHAPLDEQSSDARDLSAWCAALPCEIHVVAGNHDRGAAKRWLPPVNWHVGDWLDGPFRFVHDAGPQTSERSHTAAVGARPFNLSGHIHPVARLGRLRRRAARVPIFWHRRDGLILPSFGLFTGGFVVTPRSGDRVFAVGSERVVPFPEATGTADPEP